MRTILLLFPAILYCTLSSGQNKSDEEKIRDFKADFLQHVEMYQPDTLITSNALLTRERLPNVRRITSFPKKEKNNYVEYYYNDTKILESTYNYDSTGKPFGIARQYTFDGKPDYTQDYDKGVWTVHNKKGYPFGEVQNNMKLKADSLIARIYGKEFFNNNTTWCIDGSAIYNEDDSGSWTDKLNSKPNKFLFRYDVKFDKTHTYDEIIEFELDSVGNFIPNEYEEVFGFEEIPGNYKKGFTLSYEQAIEIAKKRGLVENDTAKAIGYLKWEGFKTPTLYNGRFRFYVLIKTATIENIVANGRSSRIDKFDVYSINPWTAEFIEKKKMKAIRSWEKMSGSSTGLLPDR